MSKLLAERAQELLDTLDKCANSIEEFSDEAEDLRTAMDNLQGAIRVQEAVESSDWLSAGYKCDICGAPPGVPCYEKRLECRLICDCPTCLPDQ